MLTIRFAIWLIAVILGAIYTIIQTGPDAAGQNLCRLIHKVIPSTTDQCVPAFQDWGPTAILAILIIFVVLIAVDLIKWVKNRQARRAIQEVSPGRQTQVSPPRFRGITWENGKLSQPPLTEEELASLDPFASRLNVPDIKFQIPELESRTSHQCICV
jgi:hypothetical protein